MKFVFSFFILISFLISPQNKTKINSLTKIPDYYQFDNSLSDSLLSIVKHVGLDRSYDVGEDGIEQISFAVIDLNSKPAKFGGVHFNNFIYPASVYKMYVAADILKQISEGKFNLDDTVIVKSPNDVDKSREINSDPKTIIKRWRYSNSKLSFGFNDYKE